MAELRWNPFIKDWVMIASHRQGRPQMPKDWCPFCPGSGNVPEHFNVLRYDNDFPALSLNPSEPDPVGNLFFKIKPSYGKCEVILYTPEHTKSLSELSVPHVRKLVDLWIERFIILSEDPELKYIFIFENRGEAVGVTMPHPHGQIYGYSYLPKKIELECVSMNEYQEEKHRCLLCDSIKEELKAKARIIYQNNSFLLFLPFYSEYPYGIQIASKRHFASISDMNDQERNDLALILLVASGCLDELYNKPFPYMMCFHNAPVNQDKECQWHFHIEYFPPMRSADKQKFNASSETGVWAHCNPTSPEEKAIELREACSGYLKKIRY